MNVEQITPRVRRWLRHSRSARVLHMFATSWTLVNDSAEVISLVTPEIGPGPFHAVLAEALPAGLDVEQPVVVDGWGQTLTVGPQVLDFKRAVVWEPVPAWSRLRDVDRDGWPATPELLEALTQALNMTVDGLLAGDPARYMNGVARLLGRGEGLTPAGDDVLMGVLYALRVWMPGRTLRPRQTWLGRIPALAKTRTTTLSANFLMVAAKGEATWPWHDLVNNRPQAAERILAIGHTSGADAWAGFIYTGVRVRGAFG